MLLLKVINGSVAYGLADDKSDIDVRSVRLETPEQVFGLETVPPCYSVDTEYTFKRFMKLLHNGNPSVVELLFIDPEHTLVLNRIFKKHIYDNRDKFLSKKMVISYMHAAKNHLNEALHDNVPARSVNGLNTYMAVHSIRLLRQLQSVQYNHTLQVSVSERDRAYLLRLKAGKENSSYEQYFWQEFNTIDIDSFPETIGTELVNELMTKVYAECFYASPDVRG